VLGQLAWGGLGTVLFALVFELIAGLVIASLTAIGLAILIGPEQLSRLLRSILNNPRDASYMFNVISGQPVVLVVAIIVALLFLGMIVPLIEETLKSIGPAALIARQKPHLSTALIWGLAAGAGYAFSENLLNGASGATPSSSPSIMWALLMLLRGGTSFVHMATTATVSLGWHALLIQRQQRKFLLLLVAALAAHGFWNVSMLVLAAVTSRVSLPGAASDFSSSSTSGFAPLVLVLVVVAIFASLILAAALWIAWLVRWTKKQESQATV